MAHVDIMISIIESVKLYGVGSQAVHFLLQSTSLTLAPAVKENLNRASRHNTAPVRKYCGSKLRNVLRQGHSAWNLQVIPVTAPRAASGSSSATRVVARERKQPGSPHSNGQHHHDTKEAGNADVLQVLDCMRWFAQVLPFCPLQVAA